MTDSGMEIWNSFFDTPPDKTPLSPQAKAILTKTLIFKHRPEISRVIFCSASASWSQPGDRVPRKISGKISLVPLRI